MAATRAGTKQPSREQETWSADAVHEDFSGVAEQPGPLPEIEARPGFSQRWIRTKIGGEDDPKNLSASFNAGWKRRDPSTIPANVSAPTLYVDGLGESVGISGMILMERPQGYSNAQKEKVRQRTNSQMEAVDQALANAHAAHSGFGAPARTGHTVTQTGSMPIDD